MSLRSALGLAMQCVFCAASFFCWLSVQADSRQGCDQGSCFWPLHQQTFRKRKRSSPDSPAFRAQACLPSGCACHLSGRWSRCPAWRSAGRPASPWAGEGCARACVYSRAASLMEPAPRIPLLPGRARVPILIPRVRRPREAGRSLHAEPDALPSLGCAAGQASCVGSAPPSPCALRLPRSSPAGL